MSLIKVYNIVINIEKKNTKVFAVVNIHNVHCAVICDAHTDSKNHKLSLPTSKNSIKKKIPSVFLLPCPFMNNCPIIFYVCSKLKLNVSVNDLVLLVLSFWLLLLFKLYNINVRNFVRFLDIHNLCEIYLICKRYSNFI